MKALYPVLAMLACFVSANAQAVRPYYTYVGAGYASESLKDEGGLLGDCDDKNGWYLNGSLPLNNVFYVHGERSSVDSDGCRTTYSTVGAGIRGSITSNSDIYSTVAVATFKDGGQKERGLELSAGVRSMVQNDVELRGYFGFRNIDEDEFAHMDGSFLGAGFSYWFTHGELAFTGDFTYTDEETRGLKLGLRINLY